MELEDGSVLPARRGISRGVRAARRHVAMLGPDTSVAGQSLVSGVANVVNKIKAVPTSTKSGHGDVPVQDVLIISARRANGSLYQLCISPRRLFIG